MGLVGLVIGVFPGVHPRRPIAVDVDVPGRGLVDVAGIHGISWLRWRGGGVVQHCI